MSQFRRVAERSVYDGRIWRVDVVEVEGPDGRFERDLVRSRGAVSVVPVLFDPEGVASVVLVRQYRAALDQDLLEIPAGLRDVEGEDPETTARRELVEEVGLAAGRLELLTVFANSAGMTDSRTYVYLATGLRSVPSDRQGPEEAAMEVVQLPLAEAVEMAADGRLEDAKTVIGLLLTGRRLADGDAGAAVGAGRPGAVTGGPGAGGPGIGGSEPGGPGAGRPGVGGPGAGGLRSP